MMSQVYKNRVAYYNFMKDFIKGKITPWEFREQYWNQRNKDVSEDNERNRNDEYNNKTRSLSEGEEIFEKQYSSNLDFLYDNVRGNEVLREYEQEAKRLNVSGQIFFCGIFEFLDLYVKDYYPSDDEGFDPVWNVDEQTLTKRIQMAFDVLERNKERWEYEEGLNFDIQNVELFIKKVKEHVMHPDTIAIGGFYTREGVGKVVHFYNPKTGLNAMKDMNGNFVSGWKLNEKQKKCLKETGTLGGD